MKRPSKDTVLQEFKATEAEELLVFLIQKNVRKSRSAVKSLLAHKQISVNGKLTTQFDYQLNPGDVVQVMKFDQTRKQKKLRGLTVVYEDEHIIVADKEIGLLSVSTDKERSRTAYGVLSEYVRKRNKNGRVYVLHRLDREVSGLMIFAKEADIQSMFQSEWDKIVKELVYAAVVEGEMRSKEGVVKSWLTENKNYVMQYSLTDNGGLESVTRYTTLKATPKYSLLNLKLDTRRKNQARIHMKQTGHSIVGDKKYGASSNPIKRIALHVQDIVFYHPVTKEKIELKSTAPKKMLELLNEKKQIEKPESTTKS